MTMILKLFFFSLLITCFTSAWCDESNEFKIKRENEFSFLKKPSLEKDGEGFQISFETKSFCDVTVVIEEDGSAKIVRHLISGVLGSNAPEPLQKNSKTQKIYFDGKNDGGEYLKNFNNVKVRVSLGLSPQYEKSLFDNPKRRHSGDRQILCPIEEGVLVYVKS